MDPLKLLHTGLYSDDTQVILRSLRRLETIAMVLGPNRARSELLPMLAQYATLRNAEDIASDNAAAAASGSECAGASPLLETFDRVVSDEALAVMAEQLGELCSTTVQVPAGSVLPMLEAIMQADETCVREAAVRGASRIIELTTPSQVSDLLVPCCERLSHATWFSGRCSSAQLIVPIYKKVTSDQSKSVLRGIIQKMCSDETPMVRKAAFTALPALCSLVGPTFLRSDLIQSLRALCEDDQDSVRILIVDCAVEIGKSVDASTNADLSVPLVEEAAADSSWKVRRHLAKMFAAVCKAATPAILTESLMPLFAKLVSDSEPEVRTALVDGMLDIATAVGPALATPFMIAAAKALAIDSADETKFAFAKIIAPLCPLIEQKAAQANLLPIIVNMLGEEAFDLRCNVLHNVDRIAALAGGESWIVSLAPIFSKLSCDVKWRIRLGVVNKISALMKSCSLTVYESKYHEILLRLATDRVAHVRSSVPAQVKQLIQIFGVDWGQNKLIPELLKHFDSRTNYLFRLIPMQITVECMPLFKAPFTTSTLVPILINAIKDNIPNVRICAARNIDTILPLLDAAFKQNSIRPVLNKLKDDTDQDVKFFADQALSHLS